MSIPSSQNIPQSLPGGRRWIFLGLGLFIASTTLAEEPPTSGFTVPKATTPGPSVRLGPDRRWKVVEGNEKENYYQLIAEDGRAVFHAACPLHVDSVTMARDVPAANQGWRHLTWSWRVHTFPKNSDERNPERADSALAVYSTFGGKLHRQSVKYIWSAKYPKGTIIGPRHTVFYDVVTVVLQGPGGENTWANEQIDVSADYIKFFGNPGMKPEEAPPMIAVALLTDGDETQSTPSADYSDFLLKP